MSFSSSVLYPVLWLQRKSHNTGRCCSGKCLYRVWTRSSGPLQTSEPLLAPHSRVIPLTISNERLPLVPYSDHKMVKLINFMLVNNNPKQLFFSYYLFSTRRIVLTQWLLCKLQRFSWNLRSLWLRKIVAYLNFCKGSASDPSSSFGRTQPSNL